MRGMPPSKSTRYVCDALGRTVSSRGSFSHLISFFVLESQDPDRKKRALQSSAEQSPVKKKKTESSFSSLVKKVSNNDGSKPASSASRNGAPESSKNSACKTASGDQKSAEPKGKASR